MSTMVDRLGRVKLSSAIELGDLRATWSANSPPARVLGLARGDASMYFLDEHAATVDRIVGGSPYGVTCGHGRTG